MPNATFCNPRLFADDTCLIVRKSTLIGLEHECNREIQKLRNGVALMSSKLILRNRKH